METFPLLFKGEYPRSYFPPTLINGSNMKIREPDIYYGCVLTQIIEHASTTHISKLDGAKGLYEINGDRQILIKYSTAEDREWRFSFRRAEIANIKPNEAHTLFFLVLVCGRQSICLLDVNAIQGLLPENEKKSQSIVVNFDGNSRMHIRNEKDDIELLPRIVSHKAFPAKLLNTSAPFNTPYAWPPLSTLSVYRGYPARLFSSNDRTFDLSDLLTSNLREGETAFQYIGISSQSNSWDTWSESALCRIEERIRYLFEFDGFGIEVERISKEKNQKCIEEFIWKIEFWMGEREIDALYDQALPIVLKYGRASPSLIQRHLKISYARAAHLIAQMKYRGAVSEMKSIWPSKVDS